LCGVLFLSDLKNKKTNLNTNSIIKMVEIFIFERPKKRKKKKLGD